jgi:hypothetical protein
MATAKQRATNVKRNVKNVAHCNESFRDMQKMMKEKGAVTGTSLMALLQESVSEMNQWNEEEDEDLILQGQLEDSQKPSSKSSATSNEDNDYDGQEQHHRQHELLSRRLDNDPLFGGSRRQKFIKIPSRVENLNILIEAMHHSTEERDPFLLAIHGDKYVGKSELVHRAIETVQIEGFGFTVLRSRRSSNNALTSLYPFREVVSSALRGCNNVTQPRCELLNPTEDETIKEVSDSVIVQQLLDRKILNKGDQLMLGTILPDVVNSELLSLLQGRSPTAKMSLHHCSKFLFHFNR